MSGSGSARMRLYLGLGLLVFALGAVILSRSMAPAEPVFSPGVFDGSRAFSDVETQVAFGPRVRGEAGHAAFLEWAQASFSEAGWKTMLHDTDFHGFPVQNLVVMRDLPAAGEAWILIAAHYDTRMRADRDPDPENRAMPVPGANDGASGVAVLVELARVLPDLQGKEVWLVLFDAEDNGEINGMPWIIGSSAFVRDLGTFAGGRMPDAVIVVDMVGDADLNIHPENYSDPEIVRAVWEQAAELGYQGQFPASAKYSMLDDHTPFVRAGIPVALLIDFDYPYWHTLADTTDKVSAESLQAVGATLLAWLQD